jgi:hypothetical protein
LLKNVDTMIEVLDSRLGVVVASAQVPGYLQPLERWPHAIQVLGDPDKGQFLQVVQLEIGR